MAYGLASVAFRTQRTACVAVAFNPLFKGIQATCRPQPPATVVFGAWWRELKGPGKSLVFVSFFAGHFFQRRF